ncbi:MAG: EAL domain-containing protein [Gemmatimonadetes bacterium]|nr:EAL domain-containing protein [Gemmatimonadota bacterium]
MPFCPHPEPDGRLAALWHSGRAWCGSGTLEATIPDEVQHPEAAAHADRGFRILAGILDDAARQEVEGVLFDQVTQLPTLQLLLTRIRSTLESRNQVGLVALLINPSVRLEELFGWATYEQVVRTVSAALQEIKAESLRRDDTMAELSMSGNSFVFVLSPPRYQASVLYDDLARLRDRIDQQLRARLKAEFPPEVVAKFTSSVGCSIVNREPDVPFQRLVLRALDEAYGDAFRQRDRELAERVAKLTRVIEEGELHTVYQPIADIRDGAVLGYEACTRGPPGELQDPSYLFKLAYEAQLLWKLERVCRELALERAVGLPEGCLLFLNTDPDTIFDPELTRSPALRSLAGRVVLEITERAAISDYALFRRAVEVIRSLGLRFAIDDVGSAYSGLRLIAEIRPDFVKLDMALAHNLPESVVQRDLVRTVAQIAESLNAPLIIEGVERREQLDALQELGIRFAQGFLIGLPQPGMVPVDFARLGWSKTAPLRR